MIAEVVMCLALNIYFEAKGESDVGKWAVGQVVYNRVYSPRWRDTVCEVIKQPSQFSWYWDGKSDKPKHGKAWETSLGIARALVAIKGKGMYDFSGGANHYYNPNLASPPWRNDGELVAVI
ncbi:MAG: cell wall hydrolase, partial [Candidatus Odinarchaeia archaeon]